MNRAGSIASIPLPNIFHWAHNGVVLGQALLALLSPLASPIGQPTILDRYVDLIFVGYLGLILLKCIFDRPSFRLFAGLFIVGTYGIAGFVEAYTNNNVSGFMFEAKLLVSSFLFFCLLEERPTVSDISVKILFVCFIIGGLGQFVLSGGSRLHVINESNYVCMYIGIAMFSYLSYKGKQISVKTVIGLGIFTGAVIIISQSRTGAGFLVITWLVYLAERFGFRTSIFASVIFLLVGIVGAVAAVAMKAPIVERFAELKDPRKVDRFIYMAEASKIMKARPPIENFVRLSFAEPVSTRVDTKMKWLTAEGKNGTESGQLYPHHFHLAYLRILIGHGFVALLIYIIVLPFLWKFNKYLCLGVAICSVSMSVPYLSMFFGALQLAMAFPSRKQAAKSTAPERFFISSPESPYPQNA